LFGRDHREVYGYCRRRTDADTAADCVAETFLVAWRRLDDVPDGDAALGWLYGVARRTLANEYRRTRRWRRLLSRLRGVDDRVADATPEVVVVQRERDRTVLAALEHLRPEDRELLCLALWEELPHAEIGVLLGCSTDAATHRIHRATRRAAREYRRLDRSHVVDETPRQVRGGETT
jgi:RNA polymerase sigma-70 factor (ECF subfamily)